MQDICSKLFKLAQQYLTVRHNQVHTEISYRFAQILLEKLGGKQEIVLPAIILHDIGWSAVPTEQHLLAFGFKNKTIDENIRRVHEVEGAKIASRLLEEVSLEEEERLEICRIIEGHDSRKEAFSLEEMIVKDADKLWRFTPEGFSIDVERFEIDDRKYWGMMQQFKEQDSYFFTNFARELATEELKKVEKQISS